MSPRKRQVAPRTTPKPPTIKEVAEQADVSTATVSRVLSGQQVVTEELIERVRSAVTALDYHPNRLARNLRKRATEIIGVVVPDLQNPFNLALVQSIQNAAEKAGYAPMLCDSGGDPHQEMVYLSTLRSDGVAGIILVPCTSESDAIRQFIRIGPPMITVDSTIERVSVDCVTANNQAAAALAVQHLIDRGHTHIALIGGNANTNGGMGFRAGYQNALEEAGIQKTELYQRSGEGLQEGGYREMLTLLDLSTAPTAVVVTDAQMVLGVLQALAEREVNVPNGMAVVGIDDVPWAKLITPRLTVVDRNAAEAGEAAIRLLVERAAAPRKMAREIVLQPHLTMRESA